MALFQIDPDSIKRPYLPHPGRYGSGTQLGGQVQFNNFVVSCRNDEKAKGPGLDRDCAEDDYSRFVFEVLHPDSGKVSLFSWQPHKANSGSKLLPWLRNLGFAVTTAGEFDPDQVKASLPKECLIEVGAPRKDRNDPEKWYTGDVLAVFGL